MEVLLKFELVAASGPTGRKAAFWAQYASQAGIERSESDESFADQMEARIYSSFLPNINQSLRRHFSGQPSPESPGKEDAPSGVASDPLRNLTVTIVRIDYRSLELLLKVLGLDDGSLLSLVAAALEVYGPAQFAAAMPGGPVPLQLSAQVVGDVPAAGAPQPTPDRVAALYKIWMIANGSLIVPVILALVVLYVAFNSVAHQMKDIRGEQNAIRSSTTEFIKVITEQNGNLARTLSQSATDVANTMKQLQQWQLESLKHAPPPLPRDPRHGCWFAVWCS